ncbi:MAG TPA: hypothetical protein VJB97_00495 [Candidatus Paceibacterota bacterium]
MATKQEKRGLAALATAGAAAAAAGYYFYVSTDAKSNRRRAAGWARDLKRDVLRQAKRLRALDRDKLVGTIEGVARIYERAKNVDARELRRAAVELKKNWHSLAEELQGEAKRVRKRTAVSRAKRSSKK